jgi:hypothetical protein
MADSPGLYNTSVNYNNMFSISWTIKIYELSYESRQKITLPIESKILGVHTHKITDIQTGRYDVICLVVAESSSSKLEDRHIQLFKEGDYIHSNDINSIPKNLNIGVIRVNEEYIFIREQSFV